MDKIFRRTSLLPAIFNLVLAICVSSCISDTNYSKGYSDEKFSLVRIGMTEQQVLNILGEPLTRWHPYLYTNFQDKKHFVGLQYSESPSGTHYNLRQIYLDNGKVAEIISYFYID